MTGLQILSMHIVPDPATAMMDSFAVHPSALALHKQQSGDSSSREPPPYPGHLQLWQQSGYSTSYSGSEASTDMSMSSLESLSTSARQDPQGEETANLSPSMVDRCLVDVGSSCEMMSSSVFGSESDLVKIPFGGDYDNATSSSVSSKSLSASPSMNAQRYSQNGTVPKYTGNSLIRQLLQASPQFSHLLGDLTTPHGIVATTTVQPVISGSGSPKSHHHTGSARATETWTPQGQVIVNKKNENENIASSPSSQLSRFHASNCRTMNGYVNVADNGSPFASNDKLSTSVPVQPTSKSAARDRLQRPSTAPATDHALSPFDSTLATSPSDQSYSDRRRSFEALDRMATVGESTSSMFVADKSSSSGRAFVVGNVTSSSSSSPSDRDQTIGGHREQTQQASLMHPRSSPEQCSSSSPRSADSYQQRSSPQLQQDPSSRRSSPQQRSSPSQQKQQLDESCPLPATCDAQQTVCAHAAIATRATQMVERLSEENRGLRQELKGYYKKVSRLEKVERDIQKVSEAYETLSQHSQKRENLEKLMRLKLESEINCMNETNQQLQDQLERSLSRLQKKQGYSSPESELKKELGRKDSLIARLIVQNRELLAAKLRLQSDFTAQRSAMNENRSRVEMLEDVIAKEALEKRRLVRQQSVSSDHQFGRQASGDKSDCGKLDEDYHFYKLQQCDTDDGISSDSESPTSIHSLIRQMQEKERHIMRLEADIVKWEEKYLEETVFRQLAVDAISIPKDAKIAALVQNSADTDRLLADARLEKLAFLKELHMANERCAQLEARIKCLQADLAAKDSLVQVLQRHSSLSRASSISSLLAATCSSPLHSPQQQHRSPTGMSGGVGNGGISSKPSSGSSSRQSSQLSAACGSSISSSLPKHTRLVGLNSICATPDIQTVYKKVTPLDVQSSAGEIEMDQLKQCFWQV